MDCIFCKIASGEIPTQCLYEDDRVIAFNDLSPQAPIHFLVIPKEHIKSAAQLTQENAAIVAHIFTVIAQLTEKLGLKNGYRIVNNCGKDGGQSVEHLHFHVLGGRMLAWPPG